MLRPLGLGLATAAVSPLNFVAQGLRRRINAYPYIEQGKPAPGTVSYTHLDVYKRQGLPQPAGIIAISPWVDLTLSGQSYTVNEGKDPLLTKETLSYYAACYAPDMDLGQPYLSPLFGDLTGMPRSILFAGGDELLLSCLLYTSRCV